MQKFFSFFLIIFLCLPICAFADKPIPSSTLPQVSSSGALVDLNGPDIEKIIRDGEAVLRKFRTRQDNQEQKQHIQNTQREYREAVALYQQRRLSLAKDTLGNVENLTEGYKSTDTILKKIDQEALEKLRQRRHRNSLMEDPQTVIDLAKRAEALEQQVADLENDKYTAIVKKKTNQVRKILERLKRERMSVSPQQARKLYIQEQLDLIDQKADNFDQKIFKLTQSKDYATAQKEYDEFQQAMIIDLVKLKKTMSGQDK